MNLSPVKLPPADDELSRLVESYCDGEITGGGRDRLESLLSGDRDAKLFFIAYLDLHAQMQWLTRGDHEQTNDLALATPVLSTTHYPLPTTFVGGPVFSYMVATVVLCLMLLGAWVYKISRDPDLHVVDNSRSSTISAPSDQPEFIVVGIITGIKDCQWSNEGTPTVVGASVPVNRQYTLTSGLMEITYKSGARVILEGPCAYTVDSTAGGYLAVGKLTARVETKGSGGRVQGSEHSPLATRHSPLFAVRTPTAIITDLGTEFGVEVDANGDTTSYVFQGSIRVQGLAASAASSAAEKVLHVNESIRVSGVRKTHQDSNSADLVHFTHPTRTPKFVRRIPKPPPVIYLCDTFENPYKSNTYGKARDYGLNECLTLRQTGIYHPIKYVRGGDYYNANRWVHVDHHSYPGKLNLFSNRKEVGWVTLNRNFPRNVELSAELIPDALRHVHETNNVTNHIPGNPTSTNWLAVGIRGRGVWLNHRVLSSASDAGAVIQVRSDGKWSYFEHGNKIIEGRISHIRPYRITIRAMGNQLSVKINGRPIDLNPNGSDTTRMFGGLLADTKDNFISIGASQADESIPPNTFILNSIDNLTIRSVCREGDAEGDKSMEDFQQYHQ